MEMKYLIQRATNNRWSLAVLVVCALLGGVAGGVVCLLGTASPASIPMPTLSGSEGSAAVSR